MNNIEDDEVARFMKGVARAMERKPVPDSQAMWSSIQLAERQRLAERAQRPIRFAWTVCEVLVCLRCRAGPLPGVARHWQFHSHHARVRLDCDRRGSGDLYQGSWIAEGVRDTITGIGCLRTPNRAPATTYTKASAQNAGAFFIQATAPPSIPKSSHRAATG